jgi:hydrogenase expression/formation protein HypC
MCLAIPMVVESIEKNLMAVAEAMGVKRNVSIVLVPDVQPGEHVLVHAGFAMEKIDKEEAEERIEILERMLKESG